MKFEERQQTTTSCGDTALTSAQSRRVLKVYTPPRDVLRSTLLVAAYAIAWSTSSALLKGRSDLDLFFWPVAQFAASGHPLLIYSASTMGAGPYANGPLGVFSLVPVVLISDVGGWASNAAARTTASNVVFALLAVAMAFAGVKAVENGRGIINRRLGAYAAFLLAPPLWISVADYGHFEQPMEIAFTLLAVMLVLRGRFVLAGVTVGLALLTRTTALLYVIPFLLLPVATGSINRGARILVATTLTAGVGLAPFLLVDSSNVFHSLVTYRGSEPISGGSVWVLSVGSGLSSFIQHWDTYVALGVASVLSGSLLLLRAGIARSVAGLCGVLAIAACCFPMLAKTVYPYYLLEPCAFATVWWLARPGTATNWRITVPLLLTLDALLVKLLFSPQVSAPRVVIGVASSAILAFAAVLLFCDLMLVPPRTSQKIYPSPQHNTLGSRPEETGHPPGQLAAVAPQRGSDRSRSPRSTSRAPRFPWTPSWGHDAPARRCTWCVTNAKKGAM